MEVMTPGMVRSAARFVRKSARSSSKRVFSGRANELRQVRRFPQFARWHLKILERETNTLVPFRLNWLQRQIMAAELRLRRAGRRPWLLILKYRRGGVTTMQQALGYHQMWAQPFSLVRTMAHRSEDTRTIFQMVDRFYENQPERHRHEKTSASTYHLEFPDWESTYKAETAGAQEAGRGAGLVRLHLSEAAFYPDLLATHKALTPSLDRHDAAYVIETTPNGVEGRGEAFHSYWTAAEQGHGPFTPLFFAWHHDPRNQTPLREPDELDPLDPLEKQMIEKFGLSLEQMKWWRTKRMELEVTEADPYAILAEYPNDPETCFLESIEGYYDATKVEALKAFVKPPIPPGELKQDYGPMMHWIEKGVLKIWEEPRPGELYVIACDPAEGVGADDSANTGFNARTGEQAFTWSTNTVPPDELGSDIIGRRPVGQPGERDYVPGGLGWLWGSDGYNPAYVIVERANHGHAVLTALLKQADYPVAAVHHEVDETKDEPGPDKRAGWRHNHIQLTVAVGRVIREAYPVVRDEECISSIRRVGRGPNGAVFRGRDRAVGVGLAAIALEYVEPPGRYAVIGGVLMDLQTMQPVQRDEDGNAIS